MQTLSEDRQKNDDLDEAWSQASHWIRICQRHPGTNKAKMAYGELVQRFQGYVYAQGLQMFQDADVAEELVQLVFIHALQHIRQLQDPRSFAEWLRVMVHTVGKNLLRSHAKWRRNVRVAKGERENQEGAPSPLVHCQQTETAQLVCLCLGKLSEQDRVVLIAFHWEGMTLKEMEVALEISLGAVKTRLRVARERMHRMLGKRYSVDETTVKEWVS